MSNSATSLTIWDSGAYVRIHAAWYAFPHVRAPNKESVRDFLYITYVYIGWSKNDNIICEKIILVGIWNWLLLNNNLIL